MRSIYRNSILYGTRASRIPSKGKVFHKFNTKKPTDEDIKIISDFIQNIQSGMSPSYAASKCNFHWPDWRHYLIEMDIIKETLKCYQERKRLQNLKIRRGIAP